MKALILGGNGMLGHKLYQRLYSTIDVWATIRSDFTSVARNGIFDPARIIGGVDISSPSSVEDAIRVAEPDVVINAVGVIKQLPTSNDVINTLTVNSILPHRLAGLSEKYGFRLISISTDCVFNGERGNYSEHDKPDAYDLYGRSKNLGEVSIGNCLTLRTSIIGRELNSAHSMVEWFLSNRGKKVNGYANAIYSGFPTVIFADIITKLLLEYPDLRGLYHVSSDSINKYELLTLINNYFDAKVEIERFDDFRIDRSLDSTKFRELVDFSPQPWEKMIESMAVDSEPYDNWRK